MTGLSENRDIQGSLSKQLVQNIIPHTRVFPPIWARVLQRRGGRQYRAEASACSLEIWSPSKCWIRVYQPQMEKKKSVEPRQIRLVERQLQRRLGTLDCVCHRLKQIVHSGKHEQKNKRTKWLTDCEIFKGHIFWGGGLVSYKSKKREMIFLPKLIYLRLLCNLKRTVCWCRSQI